MAISSTNPATGQVLKVFTELTDDEVDGCLAKAAAVFRDLPANVLRRTLGLDTRRRTSSTPRWTRRPR